MSIQDILKPNSYILYGAQGIFSQGVQGPIIGDINATNVNATNDVTAGNIIAGRVLAASDAILQFSPATTLTVTATLDAEDFVGGLYYYKSTAANDTPQEFTFPSVADIQSYLNIPAYTGLSFEVFFTLNIDVAVSSWDITFKTGTGASLIGTVGGQDLNLTSSLYPAAAPGNPGKPVGFNTVYVKFTYRFDSETTAVVYPFVSALSNGVQAFP
jgi:hypothetical protein